MTISEIMEQINSFAPTTQELYEQRYQKEQPFSLFEELKEESYSLRFTKNIKDSNFHLKDLIESTNLTWVALARIQFTKIDQVEDWICFATYNSIDFVYRADNPEILYYDLVEEKLYYECAADADHFMAACVEAAKHWYDFMFRSKAIENSHIEVISQLAGGEKYKAFWAYLLPLGVKDWE
jgi:hypothetical protein